MKIDDLKIRKQWLITFILSNLISLITVPVSMLFDRSFDTFPLVYYSSTAASFLMIIGFAMISYHCIYKKPGTKLLIFLLISSAINFVITILLYLSGKLQLPVYIPYHGVYVFISQIINFLWFIASWRMRKINKKLQEIGS